MFPVIVGNTMIIMISDQIDIDWTVYENNSRTR